MKFLTEEESESRLSDPKNVLPKLSVEVRNLHNGGRRAGNNNIPRLIQELAGTASHFSTAKEVSKAFGISPIQAHLLKKGMVTTNGEIKPDLKEAVDRNIGVVKDTAISKLMTAMGAITDEEIKEAKLLEKSTIMKDMAHVYEKVSDKKVDEDRQGIHFHIYGPAMKEEKDFESIDVEARLVK